MTKPVFTEILCSVCGRSVGKKPGVQVVLGVVCDDLLCNFQDPPTINEARDALIVAAVLEEIPVAQVAAASGVSRQRVYQIMDDWKRGI